MAPAWLPSGSGCWWHSNGTGPVPEALRLSRIPGGPGILVEILGLCISTGQAGFGWLELVVNGLNQMKVVLLGSNRLAF